MLLPQLGPHIRCGLDDVVRSADLIREAPVTSVTQVLGARVPGVVVTEGSGTTGGATRVLMRGAASISLSNQPLVFIDGVRMDGGFRGLFNVSGSGAATTRTCGSGSSRRGRRASRPTRPR